MRSASLRASSSLTLPPDSYVYKVLPVNAGLAAISSDDSLRTIDLNTFQEISNGILADVHSSVTCLVATKNAFNSLLTAGRDGLGECLCSSNASLPESPIPS